MLSKIEIFFYASIYFTSLIIGFKNFKKYNNLKGKLFLLFLFLSTATEALGAFFRHNDFIRDLVYFIYIQVIYILWFYFFHELLAKKKFSIVKIIFGIYIFFLIYDFINLKNLNLSEIKQSFNIGAISLIVFSIKYFHELLNSEKILNNYKILYFWIAIGLILMWTLYIPILYYVDSEYFKNGLDFFSKLTMFSTLAGNLCFIIGIIWSQKKYNA